MRFVGFFSCFFFLLISSGTIAFVPSLYHPKVKPPSISSFRGQQNHRPLSQLCMWIISDVTDFYSSALFHFPIPTQASTGGILCGIGDIVAQLNEKQEQSMTTEINEEYDTNIIMKYQMQGIGGGGPRLLNQRRFQVAQYDWRRTRNFIIKGMGGALIWSTWYNVVDVWSLDLYNEMKSSMIARFDNDVVVIMNDEDGWSRQLEIVIRTILSILLEQFVACPMIYALWDIPVPKILSGTTQQQLIQDIRVLLPRVLLDNAKLWTFFNLLIYNVPAEYRVITSNLCDVLWQMVLSKSLANTTTEQEQEQEELLEHQHHNLQHNQQREQLDNAHTQHPQQQQQHQEHERQQQEQQLQQRQTIKL